MIDVICGPMFSGKTEELIRRMNRFKYGKKRFLLFKPQIDDRYHETKVVSHVDNSIDAIPVKNASEIAEIIQGHPSIFIYGIDEFQFLDMELVELLTLTDSTHQIIMAGLDMDYKGQPFPLMKEILPVADSVTKLSAVCMRCGKDAKMSYKFADDGNVVDVGGDEKYEARCMECWLSK